MKISKRFIWNGKVKNFLIFFVCIFFLTACSNTIESNKENQSQHHTSQNEVVNNATDDAQKHFKLVMKIFVNLGMDEYYDVLNLDDKTVSYSYYNYDNRDDKPRLDQKNVAFDEILEKEQGVRKYLFFMYLDDGLKEIRLNMSEDFIEKVENNSDFRVKLGNALNKPFTKELLNNTITSADIL